MKVVQVIERLSHGDGMGNTAIIIHEAVSRESDAIILAAKVDGYYENHANIKQIEAIEDIPFDKEDIIIYHFGGGNKLGGGVFSLPHPPT